MSKKKICPRKIRKVQKQYDCCYRGALKIIELELTVEKLGVRLRHLKSVQKCTELSHE